ncbi:LOW QUALITY PROTEIN: nose resistant to fluoxetine protein 6 [Drosophila subobscura]|uniref:LOW QUALITY PROTEIN: nose resistant to fluoxetine protein 6 n=1 Tax=Drosophila subobscura TaxID=7241 RepID=UPI00155B1F62|nr:LOW QUALITY PROTEIN: nose resistant to fluoxetine protein 6 [Drosophila subobscura]
MLRLLQSLALLASLHLAQTQAQANVSFDHFNLTLYKRLPALYQLDDYDLCLASDSRTYCLVYAEIVPNASSNLWQQIEDLSLDVKHRFRHDRLFRGVCLQRCQLDLLQLYDGGVQDVELSSYYSRVHGRSAEERLLNDPLVNSCLNQEFGGKFSLRVRSLIEYCVVWGQLAAWQVAQTVVRLNGFKVPSIHTADALDLTVYALLAALLLLTVCSSLYDHLLRKRNAQTGNHFYQQCPQQWNDQLLTSFSLLRNYYRLTLPHGSDFARDIRFFDAFRVIGVFVVILGHTLMVFMTVQIENPEFYEQFLYRFETAIFQNGSVFIQIFFVLSGFLLYVNFTSRQLVHPKSGTLDCIAVYFRVFFYRYFRLLPSLLALILFNGSFLVRLQSGPFWRHLTEAERVFCRTNWWKNVFFVTNHMMEDSCSHQTWYLAADMQLFELFLIVIIISKKHPLLTKPMYVALLLSAFGVPAVLTYLLKLDAVYHLRPETYRYLYFRESDTFYQIYPPFYTNLAGYLLGFLCGNLYLNQRQSGVIHRGQSKYELGLWLLVPAALGLLLSGYIFIKHDFEKPSLWLALYAGLYRNLWVLICGGFVYFMCCKVGGIAYRFCSLPVFRPLARLSFQVFLWHIVVLRVVAGYFRQPVYVTSFSLFCNVLVVFVLTHALAAFVALLLEYPMVEVVKCLFMTKKGTRKEPENSKPTEIQMETAKTAV